MPQLTPCLSKQLVWRHQNSTIASSSPVLLSSPFSKCSVLKVPSWLRIQDLKGKSTYYHVHTCASQATALIHGLNGYCNDLGFGDASIILDHSLDIEDTLFEAHKSRQISVRSTDSAGSVDFPGRPSRSSIS